MTRDLVLKYFEQNKGRFLSGEELAEQIGVSRTAIWKAINTLREQGYDIEAAPKKGYCLNENSDILSLIKIQEKLPRQGLFDFRLYKTIHSTNKEAKFLAIQEQREWIIVASEKQEEGKGQKKKVFSSPEGKGVYVSAVLMPKKVIQENNLFTELSAKCIQEAVYKTCGVNLDFEAPSLLYQGQKVGGLLSEICQEVESGYVDFVVLGMGLNVYGTALEFNHQQDDIHVSLSEIIGKYCNRSELIAQWVSALYKYYPQMILDI
jgi:BirA family biotin operon repressor/biotin-[acetyl-CoA-carboxylase] ligase